MWERGWNREEAGVVGGGVTRLMRTRAKKVNRKKPARISFSASRGYQVWCPARRQAICLGAPFGGSVRGGVGDGIQKNGEVHVSYISPANFLLPIF